MPGIDNPTTWDGMAGKPSTFPPSAHGHSIADITDLAATLAGKSAVGHTHAYADITSKPSTFPPSTHSHAISDITGLSTALAGIPKYSKVLVSAGTGIYTGAIGAAGLFTGEPAIVITPKMPSGNFAYRYTLSGSAGAGWSITVTFVRFAVSVVGNLTTLLSGISLYDTPVAVTFSITASEQSA